MKLRRNPASACPCPSRASARASDKTQTPGALQASDGNAHPPPDPRRAPSWLHALTLTTSPGVIASERFCRQGLGPLDRREA